MFIRDFCSNCFLQNLYGTEPFMNYCNQRGISFTQEPLALMRREDLQRWIEALAQLPREQQAQIELELATVSEMASNGAVIHLLAVGEGRNPPADSVAGHTALALWFFLHRPSSFHEVFLHHEVQDTDAWWNAQGTSDIVLGDLPGSAAALASALKELFQRRAGIGRFCAVDARKLNGAYCFIAQVSDRLQFLDVFTESGECATHAAVPARPFVFVYYPLDGTILLQTELGSQDRILELVQVFGRSVLGTELDDHCIGHTFALNRLKERFDPLPDAADMVMVRVKALHFRYPERDGRRQVKLETVTSDEKFAVERLLERHMNGGDVLGELCVTYAELQVTLQVNGGGKSHVIQLWKNRCNLGQAPLHERFRKCLTLWGLSVPHARES